MVETARRTVTASGIQTHHDSTKVDSDTVRLCGTRQNLLNNVAIALHSDHCRVVQVVMVILLGDTPFGRCCEDSQTARIEDRLMEKRG